GRSQPQGHRRGSLPRRSRELQGAEEQQAVQFLVLQLHHARRPHQLEARKPVISFTDSSEGRPPGRPSSFCPRRLVTKSTSGNLPGRPSGSNGLPKLANPMLEDFLSRSAVLTTHDERQEKSLCRSSKSKRAQNSKAAALRHCRARRHPPRRHSGRSHLPRRR